MLCDLTQNLTLLSLNVVLLIGAWLKSFSINAKFSSRYWSGAPCNLIQLPVETGTYILILDRYICVSARSKIKVICYILRIYCHAVKAETPL